MWAVVIRAIPWVLSGIGLADIATDWFRKKPEGQTTDVVQVIKRGWLGWLIAAALVVLILRQTELLKKRL